MAAAHHRVPGTLKTIDASTCAGAWQQWLALAEAVEIVHCAADTSFKREDRDQVFRANVDGTRAMLRLAGQMAAGRLHAFNQVSTA